MAMFWVLSWLSLVLEGYFRAAAEIVSIEGCFIFEMKDELGEIGSFMLGKIEGHGDVYR